VSCSTPSSSALADYLPAVYELGCGSSNAGRVEVLFAGQGWSDVFRVRVWAAHPGEPEEYFLKVYAPGWRSEADILFELDFIQHLDRQGLSVAMPVSGRDGNRVHALELPDGRRSMVLFRAAPGRPLSQQPMDAQSRILGALAARIHNAAMDFASPHLRAPLELDRLLDLSPLEVFAPQRQDGMARLRHAADRAREVLEALPLTALRQGVCHGDLGGQNIFIEGGHEGGSRMTVIDFDDCGPGWYAYDLGHVFMFFHLFRADDAGRRWEIFLESYRSQRDLEPIEVAAAPAFALARFLQVHAHDNPIGAAQDRWPATGYVDGTQWDWILASALALESHLPR
jgi:Ser/Thr protein kinase RdoA (MazF antagonist)